jgi:hypothetical protein
MRSWPRADRELRLVIALWSDGLSEIEDANRFKRILIATDGSDCSGKAKEQAVQLTA